MKSGIFVIAYLGIALLQFAGVWAFFREVWDWNFIACMIVCLFVAPMPVVGAILGVIGVAEGWHLGYGWGIAIYFSPYFIGLILVTLFKDKDF